MNLKEILELLQKQKEDFFKQLDMLEKYNSSMNEAQLRTSFDIIKQYQTNIEQLSQWLYNALKNIL